MSLRSKYTEHQICKLEKKEFMKEASFDDIFIDYGHDLNTLILCRESTAHEDQQKALNDQVERMKAIVDKHRQLHLVDEGIIIEDAKSGLAMDVRPKFQATIKRAVAEDIDVILVQEASRFSRNTGDFFYNMNILQNSGVGILIMEGEFWTYFMAPADYPRLANEVAKGQAESLTTARRVNRGIETYRSRGQLVSGNMFGYDLVKAVERKDNTYKINPVDGATVQLIFYMYVNKGIGTELIATHLNANNYPTAKRKGEWSASKVRRVIINEKYANLIMYGKYKVVDTSTKKKIATHIKPVRTTTYDKDGNIIQERNVQYGTWEPLVDEETWWKAQEIMDSRSNSYNLKDDTGKSKRCANGLRTSNDAYANKAYCCCGHTLSPQYTHAATDTKYAQFRYNCRWQINSHTDEYRKKHGLPPSECTCKLPAVTDVAMRLMSIKVFEYLFTDIRDTIDDTVRIIEMANKQAVDSLNNSGVSVEDLEATYAKLNNRLSRFADMYADGDLTREQYRDKKSSVEEELKHTKELIDSKKLAISEQKKKSLDIETIKARLNTYVDLKGYGVSNEMIEFFVERIIRRPNNEYVWELNLTGQPSKPNKYKIKKYNKEYSDSLQDDSNFNIIKTFVISLDECKKFCETLAHRQFRASYWNQITVKIAVK